MAEQKTEIPPNEDLLKVYRPAFQIPSQGVQHVNISDVPPRITGLPAESVHIFSVKADKAKGEIKTFSSSESLEDVPSTEFKLIIQIGRAHV